MRQLISVSGLGVGLLGASERTSTTGFESSRTTTKLSAASPRVLSATTTTSTTVVLTTVVLLVLAFIVAVSRGSVQLQRLEDFFWDWWRGWQVVTNWLETELVGHILHCYLLALWGRVGVASLHFFRFVVRTSVLQLSGLVLADLVLRLKAANQTII